MELRIRGERAVFAGGGDDAREIDPHHLALGRDLADALHEWARVAAAVSRDRDGAPSPGEAAAVVSQRGRQLASRVAAAMGTPVDYVDPVAGTTSVVAPPERETKVSWLRKALPETRIGDEPTPWATGLVVSGFVAVVVITAMVALAGTLADETSGLLAIVAALVVSAGLVPSLWLARRMPIVRWIALGAGAGIALSWIGVLVVAL
ncbi:DUF2537 domain-containing protein [Amycolatopsis sp. CA-230715]|uniref:DUF2537 domain-containing protein n=1 Tax=Amycolatopsis sp. CA-230715 TaxID=2745196 RepID=UPI001C01BFE8|nr:DUF2537 domain-containing protein [Amycolatopsis sp. CA-230715]QWF81699.1 hypothetical protein HUW46_05132 [Amycolatopsis sp. CA-230715]